MTNAKGKQSAPVEQLTVHIKPDLKRMLKVESMKLGMTMTEWVEQQIEKEFGEGSESE